MTYSITVWDWSVRSTLNMTFDNKQAAERQMASMKLHGHTFKNPIMKEIKS